VARSLVNKGDTLLEKNKPAEAAAQFRAALEALPDMPEAWRGLGMAFTAEHQDERARAAYEKYLALAPSAEDAADIRRAMEELRSRSKLSGDADDK
jgi:regulator of sirC expression with transglutaminase-like and TPR domain